MCANEVNHERRLPESDNGFDTLCPRTFADKVTHGGDTGLRPVTVHRHVLYESTCTECHVESVHSRPKRVAQSLDEVGEFVRRWSLAAGKSWTEQEIRDVTVYLNQYHYHFPCTAGYCKREAARAPELNIDLIETLTKTQAGH